MAEEEGASAVTIHARTWSDGFSGTVDWEVIAQSKARVSIPVLGNGDINSYEQGLAMMQQTGCDGVMIGRGCLGRPWVFDRDNPADTAQLRLKALKRHLELIAQFCQPQWALDKIRNHAGKYFKAMRHGAEIRNRIYQAETFAGLRLLVDNLLDELLAEKPEEQ
jgi:tRNA-dihydrouridine synthase